MRSAILASHPEVALRAPPWKQAPLTWHPVEVGTDMWVDIITER